VESLSSPCAKPLHSFFVLTPPTSEILRKGMPQDGL
jgi:hypothetical protein